MGCFDFHRGHQSDITKVKMFTVTSFSFSQRREGELGFNTYELGHFNTQRISDE